MNISKDTLEQFYKVGWERRWLLQLDKHFIPKNLAFRFRMSKTLSRIAKSRADCFRVLDLGCGVGIYDVHLLRRFPRAIVCGIDMAASQLSAALELAAKAGVADRLHLAVGDVSDACFRDRFDVILCTEILAHLPDPSRCLVAIRATASQATQIIISVPSQYHDQDTYIYHRQSVGDHFQAIESQDVNRLDSNKEFFSYYYHLYSPLTIAELLSQHGIRINGMMMSHFLLRDHRSITQRLANSINVRVQWDWFDSILTSFYGYKYAEILILDCRIIDD